MFVLRAGLLSSTANLIGVTDRDSARWLAHGLRLMTNQPITLPLTQLPCTARPLSRFAKSPALAELGINPVTCSGIAAPASQHSATFCNRFPRSSGASWLPPARRPKSDIVKMPCPSRDAFVLVNLPMNTPRCILVVPCYNEADRLKADDFRAFLAQHAEAFLLFVNDGSTDDTLSVLKRLQAELPARLDVLHLPRNSGKGEAVRSGLQQALRSPGLLYTGFWDADLATPLNAVDDLLGVFVHNPQIEMVFGARVKLLGRNIERRALRHHLGRLFATCASEVLTLPIYDTQCGAKLFRVTPHLSAVLDEPFSSRWIFDVEIIARFLRLYAAEGRLPDFPHAIYEFPLYCWTDVPGSKIRPKDFFRAIRDLIVIRRRYFKGLRG